MYTIVKVVPLDDWDRERYRILKDYISSATQELKQMDERLTAAHAPEDWNTKWYDIYHTERVEVVDGNLVFSSGRTR